MDTPRRKQKEFMRVFIFAILTLVLASCSSTSVMMPTRSEYAPKDYKPKGMVKYLNQGADFIIASRKEDAFKQMSKNCSGDYKITGEGAKEEDGIITTISQNSAMMLTSQYWYISYECN